MSNNTQKNSLADRFNDFGSMPSDTVWKNIENSLNQEKKRNSALLFWLSANAAALILLIIGFNSAPESSLTLTTFKAGNLDQQAVQHPQKNTEAINKSARQQEFSKTPLRPAALLQNHSNFNALNPVDLQHPSATVHPDITSASVIDNMSIDSLPYLSLSLISTAQKSDLPSSPIIPIHKKSSIEIGGRIALFNNLNEREQTKQINPSSSSLQIVDVFSLDSGNYVHQLGHHRAFEFEVFARLHYRRFYGTIGASYAKTEVDEIYGNTYVQAREFINKDIRSIGIPVDIGFNVINRTRFQFAFSLRMIPEYAYLKSYESIFDQPGFTSTQTPSPVITTTGKEPVQQAITFGMEPHFFANFKLNEHFDAFGQFGYRTTLVGSPLFSSHFKPNFAALSVGTVFRF